MPKQRTNFEAFTARFPLTTFARIDAVLREGETKADFIRQTVERELAAREAVRKRHQKLISALLEKRAPAPSPSS